MTKKYNLSKKMGKKSKKIRKKSHKKTIMKKSSKKSHKNQYKKSKSKPKSKPKSKSKLKKKIKGGTEQPIVLSEDQMKIIEGLPYYHGNIDSAAAKKQLSDFRENLSVIDNANENLSDFDKTSKKLPDNVFLVYSNINEGVKSYIFAINLNDTYIELDLLKILSSLEKIDNQSLEYQILEYLVKKKRIKRPLLKERLPNKEGIESIYTSILANFVELQKIERRLFNINLSLNKFFSEYFKEAKDDLLIINKKNKFMLAPELSVYLENVRNKLDQVEQKPFIEKLNLIFEILKEEYTIIDEESTEHLIEKIKIKKKIIDEAIFMRKQRLKHLFKDILLHAVGTILFEPDKVDSIRRNLDSIRRNSTDTLLKNERVIKETLSSKYKKIETEIQDKQAEIKLEMDELKKFNTSEQIGLEL